jgi:hypothetical protein
MTPAPRQFKVRSGVAAQYLVNMLTRDVTTLESVFDLIDNALDAARDFRLNATSAVELDSYGLPKSYADFHVKLTFTETSILISDNCAGITEDVLRNRTFVIGSMSQHPFGIGYFGIGLKRALFRLGEKYRLETDTGSFAAFADFDYDVIGAADASFTATTKATTGKPSTVIRIDRLREGVAHEIGQSDFVENLSTELSRRYGIFIGKGYGIFVNDSPVPAFGPGIRQKGPVRPRSKSLNFDGSVQIYIDSGMHEDYRRSNEKRTGRVKNSALTDQFGWYFVCNDRIVQVAAREPALGWTARWHQEYYGFVGWVRFVAKDAKDLPWNTKKTAIDPTMPAFREIATQLQDFAENYKKKIKEQIKSAKQKAHSHTDNGAKQAESDDAQSSGSSRQSAAERSAGAKATHHGDWTTLLPDRGWQLSDVKLEALVAEAARLGLTECYAASMLLRTVLERSLFHHLKKTKNFKAVKTDVVDEQNASLAAKGVPALTPEQIRGIRPTLFQAIEWLGRHEEYYPDSARKECMFSRNKTKNHLKELNGIVHDGDLTDSGKLATIRNDMFPLLNFLLGGEDQYE